MQCRKAFGIDPQPPDMNPKNPVRSLLRMSDYRQDLLDKILQQIFIINPQKLFLLFTWTPAHTGIERNEKVDKLATEALKAEQVEIHVPLSRQEIKTIIKDGINNLWQEQWEKEEKGRHLYDIQKGITIKKNTMLKRQEETWLTG